ncbi:hypothetical protein VLK31_07000 [Variovorax sp. H27-G14]|uniref:hypothetical protein n=1 Tax=Variovorax sp. H27-G14 TaxID=3111914 RepID=UPI0038FCB5D1
MASSELTTHTPQFDLSPQTFEQALTFANYMADSDMVPKDFKGKPGNCLIAMQWGFEVGLKPLQALQGIAVINGRPSIWGDALLSLVLSSPVCKDVVERYEGTGDDFRAVCIAQRHGRTDKVAEFSLKDAKAAGLLGKQGPWTQYRDRMLKQRARAFALRDQFADVIKGLAVAEEAGDIPAARYMGDVEVVQPETYPSDQFDKNLPAWREVMAKGRKTADQIIAMAQTKFPLTDAQQQQIRAAAPRVVSPAADAAPATDVQPKTDADGVIHMTFAQVADRIAKACDVDALAIAGDLISSVQDPEQRKELNTAWEARSDELNNTD